MYKSFCDDVYRIYTYNVDKNHSYPLFNGSRIHDGFRKRYAGFVKLQAFWIERDPFGIFARETERGRRASEDNYLYKKKEKKGKREKGGKRFEK